MASDEELSVLTVRGRWDRTNHPHLVRESGRPKAGNLDPLIGDQNAIRVSFPVA
jgi:hypothetical protein